MWVCRQLRLSAPLGRGCLTQRNSLRPGPLVTAEPHLPPQKARPTPTCREPPAGTSSGTSAGMAPRAPHTLERGLEQDARPLGGPEAGDLAASSPQPWRTAEAPSASGVVPRERAFQTAFSGGPSQTDSLRAPEVGGRPRSDRSSRVEDVTAPTCDRCTLSNEALAFSCADP